MVANHIYGMAHMSCESQVMVFIEGGGFVAPCHVSLKSTDELAVKEGCLPFLALGPRETT